MLANDFVLFWMQPRSQRGGVGQLPPICYFRPSPKMSNKTVFLKQLYIHFIEYAYYAIARSISLHDVHCNVRNQLATNLISLIR